MEADVVILVLDRLEETRRAVESVRRQNGVACHIFLVDQGSGPLTQNQLLKWGASGVAQVERPAHNLGVPGGRNRGASLGRSPFLVFLDNDAFFPDDDCLRPALERLVRKPSLAVAAAKVLSADGFNSDGPAHQPSVSGESQTWSFPGCGAVLRRDAFSRVEGFDSELFFMMEEDDLSLRLSAAGYHLEFVSEFRVCHGRVEEARLAWIDRRYYFLLRNTLYLQYKLYRGWPHLMGLVASSFVTAVYNGFMTQWARAILDGSRMCWRIRNRPPRIGQRGSLPGLTSNILHPFRRLGEIAPKTTN